MASNLHTTVKRLRGRGAEEHPFYTVTLENAQLISGRSLSIVIPSSFEDLVGLRDALNVIVERKADEATTSAQISGAASFEEIEEE
jgi:hypothetical protein